ncbi:MAG: hypothetical protein AAGG55_13955 [Pseudomonadota bacterium]
MTENPTYTDSSEHALPDAARQWRPLTPLLLLLCALPFLPGIGTGYIFDDLSSVQPLVRLRAAPELFWGLVFGDDSGPLGRPLSILTFALEQRFLSASASLSQGISIAVHCINALLVFWLFILAFRVTGLRGATLWAVIAATLWAIAPQKVSTVLYIVQRMAMLSTLLVLVATCAYIAARSSTNGRSIAGFGVVCLTAVVLAPFAKENGVLAVPVIVCAELFLLRDVGRSWGRFLRPLAWSLFWIGGVAFVFVGWFEWSRAEVTFAARGFTFFDRLMSAPEILFDYVAQFFLPQTSRMGILHDDWIPVTQSASWARTVCGVLMLTAMVGSFLRAAVLEKNSMAAFGAGVFLIGHSLESFYFPLELYFEHRNYLSSIGLVFIAAVMVRFALAKLTQLGNVLPQALVLIYLLLTVAATVNLALWWRTPLMLQQYHLKGHPESMRVHVELGMSWAASGDMERAEEHVQRSYELSRRMPGARTMGVADPAMVLAAASCMHPDTDFDLFDVSSLLVEENPVRTVVGRMYKSLYADEICAEASWDKLSKWVMEVALYYEQGNAPVSVTSLIDFAFLAEVMGRAFDTYVFATMALSQDGDNVTALLLQARSAVMLGDWTSSRAAMEVLRPVFQSGALNILETEAFLATQRALESVSAHGFEHAES